MSLTIRNKIGRDQLQDLVKKCILVIGSVIFFTLKFFESYKN